MESKRLLGALPRRRDVSEVERHDRGTDECLRACGGPPLVGLQCALEAALTFEQVALQVPEAGRRSCQPKCELALPSGLSPVQSASQVVVFTLKPVGPLCGILAQMRFGLLRERQEPLRVAAAHLNGLA